MSSLHFTIRSRLDELQTQCHKVCSKAEVGHEKTIFKSGGTSVNEFFSNVQLWKERSLHHTLETLDKAGATSTDSHMEAMENHERGAKDLFELTQVFLDRTWQQVNLLLETFADDLVHLVDNIVHSRLEQQRLVHGNVVRSLKGENQQLVQACHELKGINGDLEERLEVMENTPSSGDAILCNKLRGRMQTLARRERELVTELQIAAQERVKHRQELEKTKTQLAQTQNSLALTRAMHDKETRQLAALLQLNYAQVTQVLEASRNATAKASGPRHHQLLDRFDPLSGCTIVHLAPITLPQKPPGSPTINSPRRGSSPVLTTSPKQPNTLPLNSRQRTDRPKSAGPRRTPATNSNSKPPSARTIRHSQV